jgi:hypothetical protein
LLAAASRHRFEPRQHAADAWSSLIAGFNNLVTKQAIPRQRRRERGFARVDEAFEMQTGLQTAHDAKMAIAATHLF